MDSLWPRSGVTEVLPFDGTAVLHCDACDADTLLGRLLDEIPWEEHWLTMFGRRVAEPRRSSWHGDPGCTYVYSGTPRLPQAWTPALDEARRVCESISGTRFNGVLANLYRNGHDHMGWHADDEPVLGPEPVIASVSLGADRRMDFRHRLTGETVGVVLPHGSILVMSKASQSAWKHRIPRQTRTQSARLNLTFRRLLWGS